MNETKRSPRQALAEFSSKLRANIIHTHADANDWIDDWLPRNVNRILEERLVDPVRVKESHLLKVIRAHRRGLICLDRKYLGYPHERIWKRKRLRLKDSHGFACYSCGAREADGAKLDPHHIIFRSNSGTNSDVNLVILCRGCHQHQHDHPLSVAGGEGEGFDIDDAPDEIEPASVEMASATPPPPPPPSAATLSPPEFAPQSALPGHVFSAPVARTSETRPPAVAMPALQESSANPSMVWKLVIASVVFVIALKACLSAEPEATNLPIAEQAGVPVQLEGPPSTMASDKVGRRAYLNLPLSELTSEQTQAAGEAWLQDHPEVKDVAMVEALTAELAAIVREQPRMPAGDALDLALARIVSSQSKPDKVAAPK